MLVNIFGVEIMIKIMPTVIIAAVMLGIVSASAANKVVVIPLSKCRTAASKVIFVTNGTWTGNLGGLAGADSKCNAEAKSRGIAGTFQALLGAPEGTPQHRSIHYPVPYVTESGTYLNSDYHDLFASGGVDNPVGSAAGSVWTGLASDGTYGSNLHCNSWTDGTLGSTALIGSASATGTSWYTNTVGISCNYFAHLYCIEQ